MSIESVHGSYLCSRMPAGTHAIGAADSKAFPAAIHSADLDPALISGTRQSLSILWVDDEVDTNDALLRLLVLEGIRIDLARSGAVGIAMSQANQYDAILLDLRLPDLFGLTVIERLRAAGVRTPVVILTGYYYESELQAQTRRFGAVAFLQKPIIGADDLLATLRSISCIEPETLPEPDQMFGIVAASQPMRAVIDWIRRVAPTEANVLLTGETGTGKELVARALHQASERRGSFVPVNCAAIPEALVESEFFGYRKGAFTGATAEQPGLFEAAHRGTLLLDEIGELSLPIQPRLLRCLEGGEVRRIGDASIRRVNVRVIAATNRDLGEEVSRGRFRQDLYYRLCATHCHLAPLRERPEDVEALVGHWLSSASAQPGAPVVRISPTALVTLREHRWPGNVRELRHVLDRAMSTRSGPLLTEADMRTALRGTEVSSPSPGPSHPNPSPPHPSVSAEDRRVLAALEAHRWNRRDAARSLGVSRTTVWRALRRLSR